MEMGEHWLPNSERVTGCLSGDTPSGVLKEAILSEVSNPGISRCSGKLLAADGAENLSSAGV